MMMFFCAVAVDTNRKVLALPVSPSSLYEWLAQKQFPKTSSDAAKQLTVSRGDNDGNIKISSTFRPFASSGGAGACIPSSRFHNVAVLNSSTCRPKRILSSTFVTSKLWLEERTAAVLMFPLALAMISVTSKESSGIKERTREGEIKEHQRQMEVGSTLPTNLQFYSGLHSETKGFINVSQGVFFAGM